MEPRPAAAHEGPLHRDRESPQDNQVVRRQAVPQQSAFHSHTRLVGRGGGQAGGRLVRARLRGAPLPAGVQTGLAGQLRVRRAQCVRGAGLCR